MADSPQSNELAQRQTKVELPRLRIHHFLIWTAITAAIISGCMTFDRLARNGPPIKSPIIVAGLILGAVAIAGAFTIVGSGLKWRKRGFIFPQSPGDCLLMIVAATVAIICVVFAVFLAIFFLFGDDDWFVAYHYFVAIPFIVVVWSRKHYIAIRRHADTISWLTAFWVLMLSPFATGRAARWLILDIVAVIACIVWATWRDWRNQIPRDWTHWCGVACAISLGISLLFVFGF